MQVLRTLSTALLFLSLALAAVPAAAADGVVNINSAKASELAYLPRIGPALAERIIAHREENGEFKAPEDLMLVRGIGEKTFALMEPYVAVSGKTTLSEKAKAASVATAGATAPKANVD